MSAIVQCWLGGPHPRLPPQSSWHFLPKTTEYSSHYKTRKSAHLLSFFPVILQKGTLKQKMLEKGIIFVNTFEKPWHVPFKPVFYLMEVFTMTIHVNYFIYGCAHLKNLSNKMQLPTSYWNFWFFKAYYCIAMKLTCATMASFRSEFTMMTWLPFMTRYFVRTTFNSNFQVLPCLASGLVSWWTLYNGIKRRQWLGRSIKGNLMGRKIAKPTA